MDGRTAVLLLHLLYMPVAVSTVGVLVETVSRDSCRVFWTTSPHLLPLLLSCPSSSGQPSDFFHSPVSCLHVSYSMYNDTLAKMPKHIDSRQQKKEEGKGKPIAFLSLLR